MLVLLTVLLGCETPAPLPPTAHVHGSRNARMVANGPVRGYLIDPIVGDPNPPTLFLVNRTDSQTQARARALYSGRVFVVPEPVGFDDAKAYFDGIHGKQSMRIVCERTECPDESIRMQNP